MLDELSDALVEEVWRPVMLFARVVRDVSKL
jgi:hypothetical protein